MMEQNSPETIQKHVKVYISVFLALAFLTVVTVAVSYLKLPFRRAVGVALTIAAVKVSLVAAFFMHLISEKQIIFSVLALTFIFLLAVLLLPVISI